MVMKKVLFGVFDNGELKGQVISDSTIRNLSDSILRDIEPRIIPTVERIAYENKEIIEVSFYGNHRPYSAFGRFLIRVGTQNRHMSRNELIKLIKEEDYSNSWEKEKSPIAIEDIDDDVLKEYYGEAVNCGRLALDKYDKKQLLTILDLFHNGVMNKLNLFVVFRSVYRYNIGMTFLDLLAFKKTTVYALSNKSGIPKTTLIDIASSKTNILECSGKTLLAISKSLNISIEELLSLEKEESKTLLPLFLYDAISEYRKSIRENSSLLDCYSDQLNSSINVAEVEHLISKEQADRLRARYFRR